MPRVNGDSEDIRSRIIVRDVLPTQTGATNSSSSSELRFVIVDQRDRETPSSLTLVEPETLYSIRQGTVEVAPVDEVTLLKIRRACGEAIEYLDQALQESDIIARETILTLFNDCILGLGHYIWFDQTFSRAVAALHTAVIQSLSSVYTEQQILGLRRCLRLIRDNLYMTDGVLRECLTILSRDAEFDMRVPTADADYYDENSGP